MFYNWYFEQYMAVLYYGHGRNQWRGGYNSQPLSPIAKVTVVLQMYLTNITCVIFLFIFILVNWFFCEYFRVVIFIWFLGHFESELKTRFNQYATDPPILVMENTTILTCSEFGLYSPPVFACDGKQHPSRGPIRLGPGTVDPDCSLSSIKTTITLTLHHVFILKYTLKRVLRVGVSNQVIKLSYIP